MSKPLETIDNIAGSIKEPFEVNAKIVSLELVDDLIRVSLSQVKDKKITILKSCQASTSQENIKSKIKELLAKITVSAGNYRYLILSDHSYVTTEHSGTSIVRESKSLNITQAELENIVAKALWKIFNNQRKRAGRKMNEADINMLPITAEFIQLKLDKNRVMNPLEFSARSVEYWASLTITTKKFADTIYDILPEEDILKIEEIAGSLAKDILASQTKEKDFLLAVVGLKETAFYKAKDSAFSYIDKITWGTDHILNSLQRTLALDNDQAIKILDLYQNYSASEQVLKKLGTIISGELAILLNGVEAHKKRIDGNSVYVHSFFSIPELLQDKKIKRRIDVSTPIIAVDNSFIGVNSDFELKLSKQISSRYNFTSLFSCLAQISSEHENILLDKITKQRFRLLKNT